MSAPVTTMGSLAAELSAKKAEFLSALPAEALKAIEMTAASISKIEPNPLPIGSVAPLFELPNATGKTVSLSSLLESSTAVVITYYRGAWCPYCNVALHALSQARPQIEALGAKLVAVTPELPDESLSIKEKIDISFDVLSDVGLAVAEKFGIAFEFSKENTDAYKVLGIDLTNRNGNKEGDVIRLPVAATFVLDKSGKVVYSFVDMDYTKRAEPADIIDAIKSIQS